MGALNKREFQQRVKRLELLADDISRLPEDSRERVVAIVEEILDLNGTGMERVLEIVGQSPEGPALVDQLAGDVLVKGLLLLYNLHPTPLETRVDNALAKVRPYLGTHGGNVEVLSLTEGVLRLKLQGSCHGCQSSAVTLKLAIEAALNEAAPDLSAIEVEGVVQEAPRPAVPGFIPLTAVRPVPIRAEGPQFEACPTELEPTVVAS